MKQKAPFVRNPYNYDMNDAGDESALECLDKSLTKQSFLEESDINTIVRRFALTGELPSNVRAPQYGDFTGVADYHSALNAIRIAEESFYSMPAEVRLRFDNDPGKFVDFCSDDNNRQEAEKLGLVMPRATQPAPKEPEAKDPPKTPEKPNTPNPKGDKTDT